MDVILTHAVADFDALGAAVGAGLLHPGAALVFPAGETGAVRRFLSLHREILPVRSPREVDPAALTGVIVVDTSTRRRLGPCASWLGLPRVAITVYDHHLDEPLDLPEGAVVRRPVGAASTLVARLLQEQNRLPSPVEATAMLLGIHEDTRSFTLPSTTWEDLDAASWLLRQGADLGVISEVLHRPLTQAQRRLLEALAATAETRTLHGQPAAVAVAATAAHVDEAASVADHLLETTGAAAVVAVIQVEGRLQLIGRAATDRVDVGAALRALGGGGHRRAASASLRDTAADEVVPRLWEALDAAVSAEPEARAIMSSPVRTVDASEPVAEAADRMLRYGHSGLVVLDDGRLFGVITRRDVDRARHHGLQHAPCRAFATSPARTVPPDATLSELERMMAQEGIGRLPVVEDGRILGIVTRTDVLRARHGAAYLMPTSAELDAPARLIAEKLPARLQRLCAHVGRLAARRGDRALAVGGFVRDLYLGEPNPDLDIVVEPDGVALARAFVAEPGPEGSAEFLGETGFGTAKVRLPDGMVVDFSTARGERYPRPGALPEVHASSIEDDLRRRDFTVNALALDLHPDRFGELVDPFGGLRDLERRILRVLHPLSFLEDPTRLFRAARFLVRFRMDWDPDTLRLAGEAIQRGALDTLTPERVRNEIRRTCSEARAVGMLLKLAEMGVVRWSTGCEEVDAALLEMVPAAAEWYRRGTGEEADLTLCFLAALFAGVPGATASERAVERLRIVPAEAKRLRQAVEVLSADPLGDERPSRVTAALRSLPAEAIVLLRARLLSAPVADTVRIRRLEQWITDWRTVRLEITGDDLRSLGHPPGPAIGRALRETLAARLDGKVSGREAELRWAVARLS